MEDDSTRIEQAAREAISLAARSRLTIASAESLTGGRVAGALTAIPGSSEVFRGGVVAYSVDVKQGILGVDPGVIEGEGPVSEAVALDMAQGVRDLMRADVAVSTTGVAGPESHGGRAPGVVCIGVIGPSGRRAITVEFSGSREEVVAEAIQAALGALVTILQPGPRGGTTVE